ncbi:MAG TPA: hypothetical protein VGV92_04855 [Gammaproteobacteria bacterium]|nr:hypothetical protein [Gammaproteobacteria bacterium]
MNRNGIYLIFWLLLFPVSAFANQYVPALVGGLNILQINQCKQKYEYVCSTPWKCLHKKQMAKDKSCIQATKIVSLTYYLPTEIKKYGAVTVFYVTFPADGGEIYYMVDSKGYLIKAKGEHFPASHILPNKNQQLIFKHAHKDCMACEVVALEKVVYEFNPQGVYLRNKLGEIQNERKD